MLLANCYSESHTMNRCMTHKGLLKLSDKYWSLVFLIPHINLKIAYCRMQSFSYVLQAVYSCWNI